MSGMTMFKLCQRNSGGAVLGLSCDEEGIFLAGDYALVTRITDATGRRLYCARPTAEINVALSAAYGWPVDFSDRMAGLRLAARYLTAGEGALAKMAAVQLRIPDLPDAATVSRLRKAEELLRFNSNHYPAGTPEGGQFASRIEASDSAIRDASPASGNQLPKSETPYIAKNYKRFKMPVGSGECVPLVQAATGAPNHAKWHEGARLADHPNIPEGTAIATFVDGKYPNAAHGNHAAIFVRYGTESGRDGIYVYDQWHGKAPGQRFLLFNNASRGRSNDASAFSVIK